MKRSVQEIIELLVFGLIALLIGTGLVWLLGWILGGIGFLFQWLAGLIWSLLRFVVPIAVVGAAVYAVVRLLQNQRTEPATGARTSRDAGTATATTGTSAEPSPGSAVDASPPPAEGTPAKPRQPKADRAAEVEEKLGEDAAATSAAERDVRGPQGAAPAQTAATAGEGKSDAPVRPTDEEASGQSEDEQTDDEDETKPTDA